MSLLECSANSFLLIGDSLGLHVHHTSSRLSCGIVSALIALAKEVKDAETLKDTLCAIKNLCTDKAVKESLLKSDE